MIDLTVAAKPKSDQLNADDLIGKNMVIKITEVRVRDSAEQPVSVYFDGCNNKPWKPCKSMVRVMIMAWGHDGAKYVGKSLELTRDQKVTWGGLEVGGIRIEKMSDIKSPLSLVLTASKGSKKAYIVKPLAVTQPQPISEELKNAGEQAAMQGVEAYSAWLKTIDADIKETLRPYHAGWVKVAKAADAEIIVTEETGDEDGED